MRSSKRSVGGSEKSEVAHTRAQATESDLYSLLRSTTSRFSAHLRKTSVGRPLDQRATMLGPAPRRTVRASPRIANGFIRQSHWRKSFPKGKYPPSSAYANVFQPPCPPVRPHEQARRVRHQNFGTRRATQIKHVNREGLS